MNYLKDILGLDSNDVKDIEEVFFNCFSDNYKIDILKRRD